MKTSNLLYREEGDLERFVEKEGIEDSNRVLVQVFTGVPELGNITSLQKELRSIFKEAGVVGTTTGGEILNGKVLENSTVVSITTFEKAEVKTALAEGEKSYDSGLEAVGSVAEDETKLLIMFADGLFTNGDELVEAASSRLPGVPIAGGLAGDNFTFKGTYVFTAEDVTSRGVVCASVNTERLYLNGYYNLAWVPIGKEMEVTKAKGNRIYEIEGRPVIEIYKDYLGAEAEDLPHIAIEFPLVFEREGTLLARACLGMDEDGSMVYEGAIREGEKVRFSIWDTGIMLSSAADNLKRFREVPSESIFVYTCLGRKYLMGNEAEVESRYLQSLAPTSGFLTYGEFFTKEGRNWFMNYTFTSISLAENPKVYGREDQDIEEGPDRELMRFRALVSLVNSITRELKEANSKLEKLAEKDPLTGLYNRRKMIELIDEQLRRSERYSTSFCLLMVDIDDFKLVNDTCGHQKGDEILLEVSDLMRSVLRETDVISRWGGEEFLILMPQTDLDGGTAVAEKLRLEVKKRLRLHGGESLSVSIGITAYRDGDSLEQLVSRADRAMYSAKRKGKDLVSVY